MEDSLKISQVSNVQIDTADSFVNQLFSLVEGMRLKQWTKNFLVLAALMFSGHILEFNFIFKSAVAFLAFSLVASTLYLINDIVDLDNDRAHPVKKNRPLASGRLKKTTAHLGTGILLLFAAAICFLLNLNFSLVLGGYFIVTLLYSFFLKNVVILDVLVIASGFVLRAVAGAVVLDVEISKWLLLCTTFLALFLALCKRRHEVVLLGENGSNHRKTLTEYNTAFLDQMVSIVTGSTVISYALYTTSLDTISRFGSRNLIFTLPFVLYGIFRYLYLVHQKNLGGSPEMVLLKDKGMVVNFVLYIIVLILIIYT